MDEPDRQLLAKLMQIVTEIYEQTSAFEQHQDDSQQWYDRGYADGILKALHARGYGSIAVAMGGPDTPRINAVSPHLPWGEAYHHGLRMAERETHDVLGSG